ncbi:MAG: polysulfide reductase NrfD [Deltaproteobacteria bacterium]|nr:polysulfide reductase NrfD [Deltaproteobacteria bacterium]
MKSVMAFTFYAARKMLLGGSAYYLWLVCLGVLIAVGITGYHEQFVHGHIVTNMRDPVPWGIFIGTYAFLVGVAAAAMALAVPGYVYHWKPIKDIVVLGEIIAISAVIMCILFVMADLGHPERFWHLLPIVGKPNLPSSMIGMNVMILNGYLVLNIVIVSYFLYCSYVDRPYNKVLFMTLMLLSIPAAISIHTTTAFIFNVLPARPYWNSAILVPRFIATALCAGPALMVLAFQILRKVAKINIEDEALNKIVEMMVIVLFVNLLLFFAEVVTEFRSATAHTIHMQYYFTGIGGHVGLVTWAWSGAACNITAFFLLLIPKTRKNRIIMNLSCALVFVGVFIEKGIGLVLPGFTPGTLGELYEYSPSRVEVMIAIGIVGVGTLVFTLLSRVAIPLTFSEPLDDNGGITATRGEPDSYRPDPMGI